MRASIPVQSSNVSRLFWGAAAGVDYQFVLPQKGNVPSVACSSQLRKQFFSFQSDRIRIVLIDVDFGLSEAIGSLQDR